MATPKTKKVIKDGRIHCRVPKNTQTQAHQLAYAKDLPLSTYLQILIDKEHKKVFKSY